MFLESWRSRLGTRGWRQSCCWNVAHGRRVRRVRELFRGHLRFGADDVEVASGEGGWSLMMCPSNKLKRAGIKSNVISHKLVMNLTLTQIISQNP